MIPWCMRAANSAAPTATGEIATPKTRTHSGQTPNRAKLLKQKAVQYGPVPSAHHTLSSDTPKGKPCGQLHRDHIHSECSMDQIRKKKTPKRSRCVDALLHAVRGNKWFLTKPRSETFTAPVVSIHCQKSACMIEQYANPFLNPADEMCICSWDGSQHACSQGSSLLLD